ncbi:DUF192 domain-containing protein [Maritimibacter dapengensis]|uniref:DUF192 domain-containing protein n=1 Tax=Maritimibacter dapengensis TaxID=2836868 RepID=A0ABS6T492_9RHOB|nr:DUF192 domain-containing protein [Maritimibacter dapengensis]MBV7379366.1 DUF192 domain-containing protein [Maritimibacter dapengensis]
MKRICAIAALALSLPLAAQAECREDRVDIRGDFGSARFTVEIADDVEERAQGLMFRESLGASRGMLFLYESAGSPAFWMKNTLIPLDMIFVDPDGMVQHVHSEAVPGDLTGISGGTGVIAVLEIRGGMAEAIGIDAGDEMRHPFFDGENAAWSCDTQ